MTSTSSFSSTLTGLSAKCILKVWVSCLSRWHRIHRQIRLPCSQEFGAGGLLLPLPARVAIGAHSLNVSTLQHPQACVPRHRRHGDLPPPEWDLPFEQTDRDRVRERECAIGRERERKQWTRVWQASLPSSAAVPAREQKRRRRWAFQSVSQARPPSSLSLNQSSMNMQEKIVTLFVHEHFTDSEVSSNFSVRSKACLSVHNLLR